MGRIHNIGLPHRNALFVKNDKGEFLHFHVMFNRRIKLTFTTDFVGASLFKNKIQAEKFCRQNNLKNVEFVKAKKIINEDKNALAQ